MSAHAHAAGALAALLLPGAPHATLPLELPGATATVYFDDAAVADAAWVGAEVVELSAGGVVVVRDRASLAVVRHIVTPTPVAAIATDGERVFVVVRGGRVGTLDVVDGSLTLDAGRVGTLLALGPVGDRVFALFQSRGGETPKFEIVD